jgi:hypothetical protein
MADQKPTPSARVHLDDWRRGEGLQALVTLIQGAPQPQAPLSYYTPILNQCTLPHSDPKVNPWICKNGDFSLTVSSGFDRDGTHYGIPYGSCPHLVVAYIITQDHQLVEKWLRNHGKVPSLGGETRGFGFDLKFCKVCRTQGETSTAGRQQKQATI